MPEQNPQNQPANNQPSEPANVPTTPQSTVSFPWLMLCLAIFFDLIGLIPIVNFFSEILAGLMIGLWQKMYFSKSNPLVEFFAAKIIDALSLGILPSNSGLVVITYLRKKTAAKLQTPLGQLAAKKLNVKLKAAA